MSNVRCSLFVCHDFCDASQYRLAEIFRWPIWENVGTPYCLVAYDSLRIPWEKYPLFIRIS
jgi:hypothetical protein